MDLEGNARRQRTSTAASAVPERVPDERLVARALEGDRSAFEALVRRHQTPLVNHLYRLIGSRDAALLLAWMDLEHGRLEGARAGFRAALYDDPSGAWALRGWGLALLPEDPRPAPRSLVSPEDSDR